jgi:hypothetical protein
MRRVVALLWVAAAGNVVAAVANGLAGDALGAIPPAVLAVLFAFGAYRQTKHPVQPQPWTRTRVVLSVVFGGTMTLAVLAVLGWTAISIPDWPIKAVSVAGIVVVVCVVIWAVRTARSLDRQARALGG